MDGEEDIVAIAIYEKKNSPCDTVLFLYSQCVYPAGKVPPVNLCLLVRKPSQLVGYI